jgi:hypothetical protein
MHIAPCFFAPVGLNTRGEHASARDKHLQANLAVQNACQDD